MHKNRKIIQIVIATMSQSCDFFGTVMLSYTYVFMLVFVHVSLVVKFCPSRENSQSQVSPW